MFVLKNKESDVKASVIRQSLTQAEELKGTVDVYYEIETDDDTFAGSMRPYSIDGRYYARSEKKSASLTKSYGPKIKESSMGLHGSLNHYDYQYKNMHSGIARDALACEVVHLGFDDQSLESANELLVTAKNELDRILLDDANSFKNADYEFEKLMGEIGSPKAVM